MRPPCCRQCPTADAFTPEHLRSVLGVYVYDDAEVDDVLARAVQTSGSPLNLLR